MEDHFIQGKINQMTKNIDVRSLQIVEKTVDNAQLQIVEKVSETLAISLHILAAFCEEPFLKVKSLIDHGIDRPIAGLIGAAEQESIFRER